MSLIRTVKQENPFVQLDKYFLSDERLSWGAKGILAYILSKPDGWKINKEDLIKKSDDGKTKVESALLNLLACGYVNWYQLKGTDGTFGEWVYDVYERPDFNPNLVFCIEEGQSRISNRKSKVKQKNEIRENEPKADNPISDLPKVDNPTSDNHPYINNDLNNNDLNKEEEEEEDTHVTNLTTFFLENFKKNISKERVNSKFAEWLQKLPYEVIKRQLEICSDKGGESWAYVKKSLDRLKDSNATTIADVEQLQQKHADHQAQITDKKQKTFNGPSKHKRTEQVPEWYEPAQEYYGGASSAAENSSIDEKELLAAKKAEIAAKLAAFNNRVLTES